MKHTAFINSDNLIEVHLVGDILADDSDKLGKEVIKLITDLDVKGFEVRVLADYTQAGKTEVPSVTLAKYFFKVVKIDKLAAYGASKETIRNLNEVVKFAHLGNKFQIFKTRDEAYAWLMGKVLE